MRIAVLTSSRADFGIYVPLLKKLKTNIYFELEIIAFGTHLSYFHGYTISQIQEAGFEIKYKIESLVLGDSKESVSTSIGLTQIKFASFWSANSLKYDIVFCLGDRYEMFGAVSAGLPFNIKFAHIHGGETSLGAIDNAFRHAISLMSTYHFASTQTHIDRLNEILEDKSHVYNVGALSLDNIKEMELFSKIEIHEKWNVDFSKPNILLTLHPETVNGSNIQNANVIVQVVQQLLFYNFIITMPNADNGGNEIREVFEQKLLHFTNVKLIENLGTKGYFSCLQHAYLVLGNSSSGIIEAASFNKYVINLGKRQKGRATSRNVIHVNFILENIIDAINQALILGDYKDNNIYWNGGAGNKIIKVLENI